LDAAGMLEALSTDGVPQRERFRLVVGGAIDRLARAGFPKVRACGEMVDLLRPRDFEATLLLETLWNEILVERGVTLLCSYGIDPFDERSYRGLVQRVAATHSHLIPVEDYARLDRAVDRAYAEVFGSHEDGRGLRAAFLQYFERPAAMPDAEAALLAVREFMPRSADAVIASARRHYCLQG